MPFVAAKPTNYPFTMSNCVNDMNALPMQAGGEIKLFYAAATTLLVGDFVFVSGFSGGQPQVNKSAVLANYTASAIGVVCGGALTDYKVLLPDLSSGIDTIDTAFIGMPVVTAINQMVLVMVYGVYYTTYGVTIATPSRVTASAVTAGQITTVGYAAGSQLGQTMDNTAGGSIGRILVNIC